MIRLLSISLLIFVSVLPAQVVEQITIAGNTRFNDDAYLRVIDISEGSKIFEGIKDTVSSRIASFLNSEGYYHFTIDSPQIKYNPDSTLATINIEVAESFPSELTDFRLSGFDTIDSTRFIDRTDYLIDAVFEPALLNLELNDLLTIYEEEGYPFANFKIESVQFTKKEEVFNTTLYIKFTKEQKSVIDTIVVEGNDKTDNEVIVRELRIEDSELYNQQKIDEIPEVLNRLRFFQPVRRPDYFFNEEGKGVLKIYVSEKQTNNFDGIVGYVPSTTDDETGFFTGYVNISLRNLFGTGRALGLLWEKKERLSQELRLRYLEPWVFSYPVNISGELYQRKQDTTYINQKYSLELTYLASEILSAGFEISTESTIPTDNENTIFTVYNSTSLTTAFSFTLNTTDDYYAPTRGVIFNNKYGFSRKKINGPEEFLNPDTETEINLQRIELDFHYFLQVFRKQIIALKLQGRELRGSSFEVSDLYPLGGTNSLRGYRERQFLGNRTFWSNLEYRYLLTPRTYAFVFFDTGYFLRNEDIEQNILRQSDFKTGYGFGLNLETGLGVLGVSYALGEGDSFSTGKLHFGIINEF
ncbi:MAG: hypothetical protein SCALA702_07380 [Melioribacteraceae bacterium]|nr:MAG: hypothetical protein SCALA702_07380 [Melioribacteraceae bacterium]